MEKMDVVDPSEVGFDAGRLAAIDGFVDETYLQSGKYPGYSLLISRGGKVAHASNQGYADDAIFRLYSMSKPITSIALLQLYEQGRFQLNDPVSRFLPKWADLRVWDGGSATNYQTKHPEREMQIRDLLTHTSGLTYFFHYNHPLDSIYRKQGVGLWGTNESMCDTLAELPLLFSPGTRWNYSAATDVCGALVEIISGLPLDQYFDEHIFEPLGMTDTSFFVSEQNASRLAKNYALAALSPFGVPDGAPKDETVNADTVVIDDAGPDSPALKKPTLLGGGGGLFGTMADYYRFCLALLQGGELDGNRIIGRKTLEHATSNHLSTGGDLTTMGQATFSETDYAGIGFGLGFAVMLDPSRSGMISSPGEYSWGGAASTLFWIDPAEELICIGLTQLMPSSAYPIRSEMRAMVYGALT